MLSEYIAAAYTLGLPHPPGNPLFVIVGRVFSILPIGPSVAIRINILAAICSAVSAGMWFLITERVLVSWFVVAPLKGLPIAAGWVPPRMLASVLINGCWGIGMVLIYAGLRHWASRLRLAQAV